ncbi:huntingtin-like isoform X2 [Amborella trichopoda]|uniref:huntingtin-like isoform X2 n=1 Tax=Amborella trichopoda TaxID=13333 RepID=UPI0005D320FE|nr:huntingtin-like isoform X2 [Amborella trichopoda]|eukprot:XP_011626593.1 huntingtin-like isoform X2 [Amborella trichopoda]
MNQYDQHQAPPQLYPPPPVQTYPPPPPGYPVKDGPSHHPQVPIETKQKGAICRCLTVFCSCVDLVKSCCCEANGGSS